MRTKPYVKTFISCIVILFLINDITAQLQTITISGYVHDDNGKAVHDFLVSAMFNQENLESTHTDSNGFYAIDFINYGGIKNFQLQSKNEEYLTYNPINIAITDLAIKYNIQVKDISGYPTSYIIFERQRDYYSDQINTYSNKVAFRSLQNARAMQDRMFRMPTGTFTYYKPELVKTYHKKITSSFTIIDKNGVPIKNARVAIKIPDDALRWGLTDENGNLTMHMEFEKGALDGKIYVSAEGYRFKKFLFQQFVPNNNPRTIQLHKNH